MPAGSDDRGETPVMNVVLGGEKFRVVCDRPDAAAFWRRISERPWEDDLVRFIAATVDRDTIFIDIGAWIGPIALLASRRAKKVIALEPDPVARRDLVANIALNAAAIDVRDAAIDARTGTLNLAAAHGLGGSVTSALETGGETVSARTITFEELSASIADGAKTVVKMDIEGHEYNLAESLVAFLRPHRAPLHLSLHPAIVCRAAARDKSEFAARLTTFRATRDLIATLARHGDVKLSENGAALSPWRLFAFTFLRRRPKNFSVEVRPRA